MKQSVSGWQYIYIYIQIYCHLQTDRPNAPQLLCVARHAGCPKPGTKSDQPYVRPISHCSTISSAQEFNAFVLAFVCLHFALSDTRALNSLEDLCITRMTAVNSFARMLNPREESVYIVIHRQSASLIKIMTIFATGIYEK